VPGPPLPRRVSEAECLEDDQTVVRMQQVLLVKDWRSIEEALGHAHGFLDQYAGAKAVLAYLLAGTIVLGDRDNAFTLGQLRVWLARLQESLQPVVYCARLRKRERARRIVWLSALIDLWSGLESSAYRQLGPLAPPVIEALARNERERAARFALALTERAAVLEGAITLWQRRARLPTDGMPPKVERRREWIVNLCTLAGHFWEEFSSADIRDAKAKRREFMRAVFDLADLPHRYENDETLDAWITLEPPESLMNLTSAHVRAD
jgi:hypothetical protein